MARTILVAIALLLGGCASDLPRWRVALAHDGEGNVQAGSRVALINALRAGCQLRLGWGARRSSDRSQTIEHVAEPTWVAVRNNEHVEVQLRDYLINLPVVGEPAEEHPRRARFGGTDKVVWWRANLRPDGSFDAVWYDSVSGELITRAPQQHPMKWFVDCVPPAMVDPLYPND